MKMKSNLDVTEILTEDHRTVSRLFEEIEAQDSAESRESLLEEIFSELEAHMTAEEEVLYPRAEKFQEVKAQAKESYQEHSEVKNLLEKLHSMDARKSEWMACLKEVKKNVEHHVREEEGRLFPTMKKLLSKDELRNMGQDIERSKQRFLKAG
jgi:hemerythrin superfamily protein